MRSISIGPMLAALETQARSGRRTFRGDASSLLSLGRRIQALKIEREFVEDSHLPDEKKSAFLRDIERRQGDLAAELKAAQARSEEAGGRELAARKAAIEAAKAKREKRKVRNAAIAMRAV